jgi:hypothetical protein
MSTITLDVPQKKRSQRLPLPLELTEPVVVTESPEETLEILFETKQYKYNPQKQVRENSEGVPDVLMKGGGRKCPGTCATVIGARINIDPDQVND